MKQYNYIYLITNKLNGKIYIGKHSTDDLDDGYMGGGILISKAEKKYGIENFTKEYLAFCDTKEALNYLERFYIKKFRTQNRDIGYNISPGGDGGKVYGDNNPMKGKHHSEDTKKRISMNTSKALMGHYMSEETKKKISEALKGKKRKPFSEETRLKMSISGKGKHNHKGENNPNWKGRKN